MRRSRNEAFGTNVFDACSGTFYRDCSGIYVHAVLKNADKEGGSYMWRLYYLQKLLKEERGIGVVEVILILVVLIGLVLIFKSQLTSLVQTIFQKITSESAGI